MRNSSVIYNGSMGSKREEQLLLKALSSRDKTEADAYLGQYFDATKSLCYFIASAFLNNEEDVEDAVMSGYGSFFSSLFLRSKAIMANPKAYLTKTIKNACLDILRKPSSDDPHLLLDNQGSHGTPSFHAIKQDLLGYLSPIETDVVIYSLMGYTESEIGQTVGKSRGRVSSIYKGALKKLAEHKEDWR